MTVYSYKLLSAPHPNELAELVQVLLPQGWEPLGAPFVSLVGPNRNNFHQAMVLTRLPDARSQRGPA